MCACIRRTISGASGLPATAPESTSAMSNQRRCIAPVQSNSRTDSASIAFRGSASQGSRRPAASHAPSRSRLLADSVSKRAASGNGLIVFSSQHVGQATAEPSSLQILADAMAPGAPVVFAEILDHKLSTAHVIVRQIWIGTRHDIQRIEHVYPGTLQFRGRKAVLAGPLREKVLHLINTEGAADRHQAVDRRTSGFMHQAIVRDDGAHTVRHDYVRAMVRP